MVITKEEIKDACKWYKTLSLKQEAIVYDAINKEVFDNETPYSHKITYVYKYTDVKDKVNMLKELSPEEAKLSLKEQGIDLDKLIEKSLEYDTKKLKLEVK